MNGVYGLYPDPQSAQLAYTRLRSTGVEERDITVISSEPLEEYELGRYDRHTAMPWLAVAGGCAGLLTAYFLTSLTQQAWPIVTGGMPIVPLTTNIIIIFELTMLGAILTTVVSLLVTAKLPSRLPVFYDEEVSQGKILVGVKQPDEGMTDAIEGALRNGTGESIKRIP